MWGSAGCRMLAIDIAAKDCTAAFFGSNNQFSSEEGR